MVNVEIFRRVRKTKIRAYNSKPSINLNGNSGETFSYECENVEIAPMGGCR